MMHGPIYIRFLDRVSKKYSNTRLYEDLSGGNRVVTCFVVLVFPGRQTWRSYWSICAILWTSRKKCILTQRNMAIFMYVSWKLSYYPRSFIEIYMTIMTPKDTSLYKSRLSLQSKKKLLTCRRSPWFVSFVEIGVGKPYFCCGFSIKCIYSYTV